MLNTPFNVNSCTPNSLKLFLIITLCTSYLLHLIIICSTDSSSWHHSHKPVSCFPIIFSDLFRAAVLNFSPRAPPLYIFCMSLLVNTPDSDNQLVRSALHEWTVFRLTCSLHSVHCSLLPEQGKAAEVYFTSEHSFMDLRCATSLRTDECDIIYVCKYIQFKFTSRTLQCTMNGIRSLRTGIMEEYRVMSTSQGTCVRIEQTSEVIRVTYEMCRAVGREDWNWEPLV